MSAGAQGEVQNMVTVTVFLLNTLAICTHAGSQPETFTGSHIYYFSLMNFFSHSSNLYILWQGNSVLMLILYIFPPKLVPHKFNLMIPSSPLTFLRKNCIQSQHASDHS